MACLFGHEIGKNDKNGIIVEGSIYLSLFYNITFHNLNDKSFALKPYVERKLDVNFVELSVF